MSSEHLIGLIPCGGHARRIAPLPCSKELLPVGLRRMNDGSLRPRIVAHHLLEQMRTGGVRKSFLILRSGKWDIPQYFGNGAMVGMDLGYLMIAKPFGPPYTLDAAYPFVRGARVAVGFPDILFESPDPFGRAVARLGETGADAVLCICGVRGTSNADSVKIDKTGRLQGLDTTPRKTKPRLSWVCAVWTAAFTEFMHEYLQTPRTTAELPDARLPSELTVGHVIQAAISEGLVVESVDFLNQRYFDIGTPENLMEAIREFPALV